MGLNPNSLRFLARDFKNGNRFTRTAMIGRQGIHLPVTQLEQILNKDFELGFSSERIQAAHTAFYADDLFKLLGAETVDSFDYSDYEGATHVHDFNTPIADKFKGNYSFVIDGGTLEHVFQFPTALKNCMEMLEIGGVYFGNTPANNEMGHGFYQFSPELYFRAFNEQNGFRVDGIWLYEGRESPTWLQVADPETARSRVEKVNCKSTYMVVRATKMAEVEIFGKPPLQPDYVSAWSGPDESGESSDVSDESLTHNKSWLRRIASTLPYPVKRAITMTRVGMHDKYTRARIHLGINLNQNTYRKFDPKID